MASCCVFNPANWPGASIKNFITDVGATCNGVADDTAKLDSWRTAAVALNPQQSVLYIPPGSVCNIATSENGAGNFPWNGTIGGAGINNLVVWAYGATMIGVSAGFSSEGFPQTTNGTALIQTVSAGSTTLTLVNSGDASKFSNGSWIAVTGYVIQCTSPPTTCGSYPPNFQWDEYVQITNISGSTITITPALQNSYKSTWPLYVAGDSSHLNSGGPATIYLMPPSWNFTGALYGLTWNSPSQSQQFGFGGRNVSMYGVTISGGEFNPTQMQTGLMSQVSATSTNVAYEMDKDIQSLTISNSSGPNADMLFQSAGSNVTINNYTGIISGTSSKIIINGGNIPVYAVGTNCNGQTSSITIQNATISSGNPVNCFVPSSDLSFSGGTFSIANNSPNIATTISSFVPGFEYNFAWFNGSTFGCNTTTNFHITDVTQDGTNTYYATDIGASLPSPSCSGHTYNTYLPYSATTITQTNSGPANLAQYAAP